MSFARRALHQRPVQSGCCPWRPPFRFRNLLARWVQQNTLRRVAYHLQPGLLTGVLGGALNNLLIGNLQQGRDFGDGGPLIVFAAA